MTAIKPIKGFVGALVGITLGTAALGATAGLTGATKVFSQLGVSLGVVGSTIGSAGKFFKLKK